MQIRKYTAVYSAVSVHHTPVRYSTLRDTAPMALTNSSSSSKSAAANTEDATALLYRIADDVTCGNIAITQTLLDAAQALMGTLRIATPQESTPCIASMGTAAHPRHGGYTYPRASSVTADAARTIEQSSLGVLQLDMLGVIIDVTVSGHTDPRVSSAADGVLALALSSRAFVGMVTHRCSRVIIQRPRSPVSVFAYERR